MAPSAVEAQAATEIPVLPGKAASAAKPWLKSTGILDQFEHIELTPVIGREYPKADVAAWLQAPNSDELIKELSLTSRLPALKITQFRQADYGSLAARRRLLPRPGQLDRRPPEAAGQQVGSALWQATDIRSAHPPHPEQ